MWDISKMFLNNTGKCWYAFYFEVIIATPAVGGASIIAAVLKL